MPPKIAAIATTAKTRIWASTGAPSAARRGAAAGGWASAGAMRRMNTMPVLIASSPGRTNAARQPSAWVSAPVRRPAAATPMLPNTPFTPSARPVRLACCTTSAVATGW
jgi:hypothetical protein